ncbi:MAG: hypothetical protein AAF598_01095 [Bacteroidota bacterium]
MTSNNFQDILDAPEKWVNAPTINLPQWWQEDIWMVNKVLILGIGCSLLIPIIAYLIQLLLDFFL